MAGTFMKFVKRKSCCLVEILPLAEHATQARTVGIRSGKEYKIGPCIDNESFAQCGAFVIFTKFRIRISEFRKGLQNHSP